MSNSLLWETHPFLGTIWKTKNSRFNAYERLSKRHWWKTASLAIMSGYVVAGSILPKFVPTVIDASGVDYIGFAVTAASLLVLALGVIAAFDEDNVRAKYLHDNAKEIGELYHRYKLLLLRSPTPVEIAAFEDKTRRRYERSISRCPYNHDELDYKKTLIDIKRDSGIATRWDSIVYGWLSFRDIYLWPSAALLVPPTLALLSLLPNAAGQRL